MFRQFKETLMRKLPSIHLGVGEGSRSLKKSIIFAIAFVLTFTCFLFPVSASSPTVYKQYYEKPTADNYSGYIEIRLEDRNEIYTWYYRAVGSLPDYVQDLYGEVNVNHNGFSVTFRNTSNSLGTSEPVPIRLIHGYMRTSDNYQQSWFVDNLATEMVLNEWLPSGAVISSVKLYGFLALGSNSASNITAGNGWTVMYGSDTTISNQLNTLISVIQSQDNSDIIANADKNADEIQANADKNADEIQANQDKNTDKVIQAQKDQAESEKNEANSTGDSGANEVASVVPNHSGSLISAFKGVTDRISHNVAECVLEMPSIKVPKIANILPNEIVLTEPQEIRFSTYLNYFPVALIMIVRALCSSALVIYCFKELYDLIEYVVTLNGGRC